MPKNSTLKPLSTTFVPCMKIHGGRARPPAPRCRRPWMQVPFKKNLAQSFTRHYCSSKTTNL